MGWIVGVAGVLVIVFVLGGAAGGRIFYTWGRLDGRVEERTRRADQDVRLLAERRQRNASPPLPRPPRRAPGSERWPATAPAQRRPVTPPPDDDTVAAMPAVQAAPRLTDFYMPVPPPAVQYAPPARPPAPGSHPYQVQPQADTLAETMIP